jgi:hypothetical protein
MDVATVFLLSRLLSSFVNSLMFRLSCLTHLAWYSRFLHAKFGGWRATMVERSYGEYR